MQLKGIHMAFFAPLTTHFSQPLDSTPFAKLKPLVYALLEKKLFNPQLLGKSTKRTTIAEAQDAAIQTFTTSIIKSGFFETGIWPWRPKKLMSLAQEQLTKEMADEKQPEAQKLAIAMTRSLIEQVKDEEEQRSESRLTGRAKVKKHYLFDVNDHVELDRQRKEQEEADAVVKEEKMAEKKRKERREKTRRSRKKRKEKQCIAMTVGRDGRRN